MSSVDYLHTSYPFACTIDQVIILYSFIFLQNGDGYVDSKAKWNKILSAVREAVAKA